MATLVSKATGNLSDTATWSVGSTATNGIVNGTTVQFVTTTVTGGITVPGNNDVVTAVALNLAGLEGSGVSGVSLTVRIRNTTDGVNFDTVIPNLANVTAQANGWFVVALDASVTLTTGKNFELQLGASVSSRIAFNRNATSGGWNRILMTTATAVPSTSDSLYVAGKIGSAGTWTTHTVTSDNASSPALADMNVCHKGVLDLGNNSDLALGNNLNVFEYGLLSAGSSGSGVNAIIRFAVSTAGQYGLMTYAGYQIRLYGAKASILRTKLTASVSAAGTSITVADSTGWTNGQKIVLTGSDGWGTSEEATINSVSGTTINLTTGLSFAHLVRNLGATSAYADAAIVALLNRGIQIYGEGAGSVSHRSFGLHDCIMDGVWMQSVGSTTFQKYGWYFNGPGTVRIVDCSIQGPTNTQYSYCLTINDGVAQLYNTDLEFNGCVFASKTPNTGVFAAAMRPGAPVGGQDYAVRFKGCLITHLNNNFSANQLISNDASGSIEIDDCDIIGCPTALNSGSSSIYLPTYIHDSRLICIDRVLYSQNAYYNGTLPANADNLLRIENCTCYAASNYSIAQVLSIGSYMQLDVLITGCLFLGYNGLNIGYYFMGKMTMEYCTWENTTSVSNKNFANLIAFTIDASVEALIVRNCTFLSAPNNGGLIHCQAAAGLYRWVRVLLDQNTYAGGTTLVTNGMLASMGRLSAITVIPSSGEQVTYVQGGAIYRDATNPATSGACLRFQPNSVNNGYMPLAQKFVLAVANGETKTVGVKLMASGFSGSVTLRLVKSDIVLNEVVGIIPGGSYAEETISLDLSGYSTLDFNYPELHLLIYGTSGTVWADELAIT